MDVILQLGSRAGCRGAGQCVSILVLMDVILQQNRFHIIEREHYGVSILVLMDVILQPPSGWLEEHLADCFNPCFNGCYSSTF